MDEYLQKLQYASVVLLMIVGCLLLSILLVSGKAVMSGEYSRQYSSSSSTLGQQNVVAAGMSELFKGVSDTTGTMLRSTAKTISSVGRTIGTALSVAGSGVGRAALFIARAPGNVFRAFTSPPSASALIRPGTEDQTSVPVIEPVTSPTAKAPAFIEPVRVITQTPQDSSWPIHGRITTFFGVPHWPYQPTHTGMDIASGSASGITPVHPFRTGRVIDTIRSSRGLGNHVIVDHGNGLTSVYAHLYSISVQVGQEVNGTSVLGLEGSTGVSTGAHLHFEIRQDGVSVDPSQYITGRP